MDNVTCPQKIKDFPEMMSIKDVAKALGVGRSKATQIVKYSDLGYIKLGNSYKIVKSRFVTWVEQEGKREYAFNEQ
jgi:excisionase family DNA binding protein